MKRRFFLILSFQCLCHSLFSQGWTAEIDLELNHNLYAYEKISKATFSFSGATASGSSETSNLHLVINGTGPITGEINVSATGLGWQPYQPDDPYSEPISASFTGNYSQPCSVGFFEQQGETALEQIYIWITIYPRLVITAFDNNCDELVFATSTCSPTFTWEVSESLSGSFRVIPGKSTASITVTRQELTGLGFADPFGRKYFRVTGKPGTTSQLQAMDIFYPPPSASFSVMPPKCHDGADGSIQVDITSANPQVINDFVATLFSDETLTVPIEQEFINDGFQIIFAGLPAGTYPVKIENNSNIGVYGSCAAVFSVPPLQNPAAVSIASFGIPDFNGYAVSCNGGADGSIKANPSGGTGIFTTYEWTPAVSTTDVAAHLSEGTYTIRVKDSNNCWSELYTKKLEAPGALSVSLISTGGKNGFDVSCFDSHDGKIESNVAGGISQYRYAWSDGSTTPSLGNAGPGTYALQVTDANGCAATGSITLAAPDPIEFALAELRRIECPGEQTGMLEVQSIANAIGPVRYAWSSGESTNQISDKPSGFYSVSVSDDQGCTATKSHTLPEPPAWSLNIIAISDFNGSAIRCKGEQNGALSMIVRDGQGNATTADAYAWYKTDTGLIGAGLPSLDGVAAGVYKGQITYGGHCQVEETFVLAEPEAIDVRISTLSDYNGSAISCYGKTDGALAASASGGTGSTFQYLWGSGSTGSQISGIGAGTYVVTASDANGCEGVAEASLDDPEPLEASISVLSGFHGQPISCTDSSDARLRASAAGGISPYAYRWNTGYQGQDLIDVGAGSYSFTVTDANGCTNLSEITLMNPEPVTAKVSGQSDYHGYGVTCNGGDDGYLSAEGAGGTGNYEFTWQSGQFSGALYQKLSAGTYTVEVRDENGCYATTQGVITEPPALSLLISSVKNVSCNNGADGQIQLLADGGSTGFSYSPDGENWQDAPTIAALRAGTYLLRVRDSNSCLREISAELTEPAALSVTFTDVGPALCNDPQGKATAAVKGGTGTYRYAWMDAGNHLLSDQPHVSGLAAGIYTLSVRDDHACEITSTVAITSTDGPRAQIDNVVPASCSYASDGSAEVTSLEGNGPYTFLWQDGQTTEAAINLRKGRYLLEITDINNCKAIESVTIPAPDSLEVQIAQQTEPTCHGTCNGRLALTAEGGNGNYHYDWGNFNGAIRTDLCAGSYTVKVTDQKQCIALRTFILREPESLTITLERAQPPRCHGECNGMLEVSGRGGSGDLKYEWSSGQADPSIENLCAGEFTVVVSDSNRCSALETFTLENPPPPVLDLGGSITLCAGQTCTLDAGSEWQNFTWSSNTGFASAQQRVTIDQPGMYWLETLNRQGCAARDTFLLETSTDLLNANFLVASTALVFDTVVVIDISWPLPERIAWKLPAEMKILADRGEILYGEFENAGRYDVTLAATLGGCRDEITKTVTIIEEANTSRDGRLGGEPVVKEFHLYPNPNDGNFDVVVEFSEERSMLLTVWNLLTTTKIAELRKSGSQSYEAHFDLGPLSAGSYTLRLDYGEGTRHIRFIVR
ncbi:MAG TPA: T9SS type A sorting domain-containing protein [Chryseosolibacter sp.]